MGGRRNRRRSTSPSGGRMMMTRAETVEIVASEPLNPADFSCAARPEEDPCLGCRRGGACLRCSPEAMATRAHRTALAPAIGCEVTVFERECRKRQRERGETFPGSFSKVLKRHWVQHWPAGTYERCETFRGIRRFEDRREALRGTPTQPDVMLAKALGISLRGVESIAYEKNPFFGLLSKIRGLAP